MTVDDPGAARVGRLGPALDRIGRLSVRDFARTGRAQVLAHIAGRHIRLRELLVPVDEPGCCPSVVRARVSRYEYRPARGAYVLARRATGPPRPPTA